MQEAGKLEAYLARLKTNKEKVPLEILKTKYKTGYEKLTANIKEEAENYLKPIAAKLPPWLVGCRVTRQGIMEIAEAFNRTYKAGGYAKRIGAALYKHYSIAEARKLSEELNQKYAAELEALFHSKTCLYTTAENWDPENPVAPRIYNELTDTFWDGETRAWVRNDRPRNAKAILLFIKHDNGGNGT